MATRGKPPKATGAKPKTGEDALAPYSAKRAFDVTPEPPPATREGSGPLLFVVQQHAARRMHWDFRIELDGVLVSWAVPKGPSLDPADKRMAVHVEDHPFDYASFEGVIPAKQYGAGEVIIWDCGVYSPDEDDEVWFHDRGRAQALVREGLAAGKLSLFLRGEKLKGSFALVRTAADPKSWLLIKHKDRFAATGDVTQQKGSIVSGLSVEDLKRLPARERFSATALTVNGPAEAFPRKLSPMLAEQGEGPFTDPRWLHEPKLDGYRVLAFIEDGQVRLASRRGLDLTPQFPAIVAELSRQMVSTMVLDGELIALGADGRPSFNALQNRAQLKTARDIEQAERRTPCVLYVFDILHFAGIDLRGSHYVARRRYLAQCLLPGPHLNVVHAEEDGETLFPAALAAGFEGVVAKRKDCVYQPGRRSPNWLKIKSTSTAEFVIGGFTQGKGSREALGSLLLGCWEDGKLVFVGHAGSGFDEASVESVRRRLEAFKTTRCPFVEKPPLNGPTTWVKPQLVAEVRYLEFLETGILRGPVFVRLRDDVDARQVKRPVGQGLRAKPAEEPASEVDQVVEQLAGTSASVMLEVGEARFKLTNLDRQYWPADPAFEQPPLTKRDLLRYLARVSPYMLPHLVDRPLTMIRMPEGIDGERFFQKHWEQKLPEFVETVRIFSESKDERQDYLLCNNLATLLWVAQAGTLEYHVWHSRAKPGPDAASQSEDYAGSLESLEGSVLNYPDYVVFDIDPYIYSGKEAPGAEPELNVTAFEKGKEVAFWLRDLLKSMRLTPMVKTSGKTGLHVFVPIERTIDFTAARHVCETIGRHLLRQHPKDITMEWTVSRRTGKIFMDYNMNVRGKTLNSAYSPRGVPGAPVSVPLTWEELAKAHPMDFRIPNVMRRLEKAGDAWRDALRAKHSLEQALERSPV